jgi:hypothetical protein
MDKNSFAKQVLLSLPPMEQNDLDLALAHLETLHPALDKNSLMMAWNERACLEPNAAGSSQMESIRRRLQDKREKLYDAKGRTHRLCLREATRDDDGKPTLTIQAYVEHLDAANVRSGYWAATWNVVILSERECELSGVSKPHIEHGGRKGELHGGCV